MITDIAEMVPMMYGRKVKVDDEESQIPVDDLPSCKTMIKCLVLATLFLAGIHVLLCRSGFYISRIKWAI